MKMLVVNFYGKIRLPAEAARFFDQAYVVEQRGYGKEAVYTCTDEPIECAFINSSQFKRKEDIPATDGPTTTSVEIPKIEDEDIY